MMKQLLAASALAVAGAGLTGCASDYGYGGVGVGYASPGYYGDYGYGPYGYGDGFYDGAFGAPYWGWYDGFYYPGFGALVYDRYRRPHAWDGTQQRYWGNRLNGWRGTRPTGPEWRGFGGRPGFTPGQRGGRPAGINPGQGAQGTHSYGGGFHNGGGFHGGGGGFHGGGGSFHGGGGFHGGGHR